MISNSSLVINLISFILVVVLYLFIYLWTLELDKNDCKCAMLWHNNYIKIMSVILLVNYILIFLVKMLLVNDSELLQYFPSNFKQILIQWLILTGILTIPYMGILLDYIIKLKELQDCKCSEHWIREYGYYFTIIYITMLCINFLLIISIYTTLKI